MTALLGLLAVAGYQNRDKLAELLRGSPSGAPGTPGQTQQQGGVGGLLSNLGGGGVGGLLGGGLNELLERFKQSGQQQTVDSWVSQGPNKEITPSQLEKVIGPDVLETLSKQTGLSRDELLARLTRDLPDAVDKYTPQGRLPSEAEFPR